MKLPGWKKEQKEKKRQKLITKVRFFGAAIILSLFIIAIFSFLKIYTASVLPRSGRTTIIFNSLPLKILTFDREGKVVFLKMPENFSSGSVQEFLGAPVDGWLGEETNLNIWDRLRVWWKIKSTKSNMVQTIDHSKSLTADPAKLDLELAGVFKDLEIVSEHLTVEVLNGSGKPEMANRAGRLITNLGATVIILGNSEKESGQCEIKAGEKVLKSFTGQRLKKIFNCREVLLKSGESRADLQMVIGLDYWQKSHLQP